MFKRILAILLIVCALVVFVGCSKVAKLEKAVVGTWEDVDDEDVIIEFFKDGTFEVEEDGYVEEYGEWSVRDEETVRLKLEYDDVIKFKMYKDDGVWIMKNKDVGVELHKVK